MRIDIETALNLADPILQSNMGADAETRAHRWADFFERTGWSQQEIEDEIDRRFTEFMCFVLGA